MERAAVEQGSQAPVLEQRMVATRAGELNVGLRGAGPPLVLLPANGHRADDFAPIATVLAQQHRVITLDWPGMGRSPAPPRPDEASAAGLADAVEDLFDALPLGRAVVLGHSVGGFAAARLAIRRPEAVAALVLVNSGGFARANLATRAFCWLKGQVRVTRAVEAHFARWHTGRRSEAARALVDAIEAARRRPGYAEVVAAVWRSFVRTDACLLDRAHEIRCPTLVAWGARDPVLPARIGRAVVRAIPHATWAPMATGHSPFVEDTATFLGHLAPFLQAARAPDAAA
jgi:pimeloyl-ACP methyl ester carboxylesterase